MLSDERDRRKFQPSRRAAGQPGPAGCTRRAAGLPCGRREQDATGPREGRRPPVTVELRFRTDLSSAHDADTGALRRRSSVSTPNPPTPPAAPANLEQQHKLAKDLIEAARDRRCRRARPHPRGAIGRRRVLATARARRRSARHRPRGRLPVVAEARGRLPGARRQGVLRGRACQGRPARAAARRAGPRARAHQRSDVRLRPARRARRGEERLAAGSADRRGRRREPAQRLAARPLHRARQRRRGHGALAPGTRARR